VYAIASTHMDIALAGQESRYDLSLPESQHGPRIVHIHYVPEHNEGDRVTGFIAAITDITERKQMEETIRNMAYHDQLTGLPNRALLYDRLQQARAHSYRNKSLMAVLALDLDYFKPINDELGHEWGDKALVEVGSRLRQCTRATDTVARIGGDEFSIILVDVVSIEFARKMAEKMIAAIEQPLSMKDSQYTMGASIGICLASSGDDDIERMVSRADAAMYKAKRGGKNRYHISGQQLLLTRQ